MARALSLLEWLREFPITPEVQSDVRGEYLMDRCAFFRVCLFLSKRLSFREIIATYLRSYERPKRPND